jgi:hypothetical protein
VDVDADHGVAEFRCDHRVFSVSRHWQSRHGVLFERIAASRVRSKDRTESQCRAQARTNHDFVAQQDRQTVTVRRSGCAGDALLLRARNERNYLML